VSSFCAFLGVGECCFVARFWGSERTWVVGRPLTNGLNKEVVSHIFPPTPGWFLEFQEAPFRFAALNSQTWDAALRPFPSGLKLWISDLGTQFRIRLVAEILVGDLPWRVVFAKTMVRGVGDGC